MSFQLKHAMSVPFSGKNWFLKLFIGVLLICSMPIIILTLGKNIFVSSLALLIATIPYGYLYISIHNELNNEEELLPNWNIVECLGNLIKIGTIKLLYALPLIPIIFGIVYSYLKIPSLKILAVILGIIVLLIYGMFIFFAEFSFLKNYKFKEAFNFSRNIDLLKVGYGKYIKAQLWSIPVCLIIFIPLLLIVMTIGFILMFIIQFILHAPHTPETLKLIKGPINPLCNFFIYLIVFNLSAQAYKMAERKLDEEQLQHQITQG